MTASYNLRIKRSAEKELRGLSKADLRKVIERIYTLTKKPHSTEHRKLSGLPQYRVRQGDYRILYTIDDTNRTIEIVKIGHRREVYR